jgi:hypothetical protein
MACFNGVSQYFLGEMKPYSNLFAATTKYANKLILSITQHAIYIMRSKRI